MKIKSKEEILKWLVENGYKELCNNYFHRSFNSFYPHMFNYCGKEVGIFEHLESGKILYNYDIFLPEWIDMEEPKTDEVCKNCYNDECQYFARNINNTCDKWKPTPNFIEIAWRETHIKKGEKMKLWEALKALDEGTKVEYLTTCKNGAKWLPMKRKDSFSLDDNFEFRIKPEPKYRPFTPKEITEFFGKVVVNLESEIYHTITGCTEKHVILNEPLVKMESYEDFLKKYSFISAVLPYHCGVLVEE